MDKNSKRVILWSMGALALVLGIIIADYYQTAHYRQIKEDFYERRAARQQRSVDLDDQDAAVQTNQQDGITKP